MKQLLLFLLFPCLCVAQYTGNSGQKITLGEQTTADGLVYRGLAADTTRKPSVDTMAYILLDTNTNIIWQYKKAVNNAWRKINLTQSDTTSFNYVNTYGTQTVNGEKTFNNRLISTNAMHFVDTALSIVSFAKKTVQPNGIVGAGTGALSSKTDYATGDNPFSVNVDPTGRFVYVANFTSNTVSMFIINQSNGTLSSKTDYATGTNPRSVNVDPTGRFVYVANAGSATVSMFAINQSNGTLSSKTDYTTGTSPINVNVDPTGRFVYVANNGSSTVSMFAINQSNGTLSSKTDYATGDNPFSVNVDPTGRFVYVANSNSSTVSMFAINQSNGTLSSKTDYDTGTSPRLLNVEPTGRFVYVANFTSNTVSMFVINQSNGTLSSKTDYTTGTNPHGVNIDPTGRFVYVSNFTSNTVSMFAINQSNGTLSSKTDYATGTNPRSVNVDPTGRFVYVANAGIATVSQYFMQSFSAGAYNITGSLGIKTDAPTQALHVVGNARITGNIAAGVTSPTARLHLTEGTATASTAPLKFTSGTNLTTAEAGAMEFNGTNLFFSPSTTRHTVNHGLTGSATLNFPSTTTLLSADLTITVTGAADGDVVSLGVPNAAVNANTCYTAWVSAANTVTVRFNNYSSGTVDPASGLFKVFVTK